MKTVTFAGSKGGSGRTTLCFSLAVEAARESGVLVCDLDPQQSLADLWRRRADALNPLLVENVKTIADATKRLKASAYARDFFLVDTPGSNLAVIREAIGAADVIVLPVQPSPIDLLSQQAVIEMIEATGKPALFVLNRVDTRSELGKEARRWLEKRHRFPVYQVGQRTAYVRASVAGVPVGDIDKDARREMSELWEIVKGLADGKVVAEN